MTDDKRRLLSRRQILRQALGTSLGLPFTQFLRASDAQTPPPPVPAAGAADGTVLSAADDQFLNDLERVNFLFFWEQGNPNTGMVKDRCNIHTFDQAGAASIAATGFGLTALCIGEKRGFIPSIDALNRVLVTLRFLWRKLPNHRGFFYHFANPETGDRMFDSEVSSVDTAILLCGVLTCREHFHHPAVATLANLVFNRVDWTWLSEDTSLLTHGWTPEIGFLPSRWDYYSELMMMYLLGMGSSAYPLAQQFPDYSEELWGITASDSQQGYVAWGGPPATGPIDGTVVPSAAGGSLPFLPAATMRVLNTIRSRYPAAWTKYGFVNAFNPLKSWYDSDVIGIDTGIILLMAENLRTRFVWDTFMKTAEARRGMERAGFHKY